MSVTNFESTDKVTRANVNAKITQINSEDNHLSNRITAMGARVTTLETAKTDLYNKNTETQNKVNSARAGVVLYSSAGDNGTITISSGSFKDYDHLEIYYKENQGSCYSCATVLPKSYTRWKLSDIRHNDDGDYIVFNCKSIDIYDKSIQPVHWRYGNIQNEQTARVRNENNIYIMKIIGYKNNI